MTPFDHFSKWEQETPDRVFLRQPFSGKWKTWTYREAGDEIRRIASAIKTLGLPERSHIALLSRNCAHWIMADLAIVMSGNISVPLYPTLTAPAIRLVLQHSDARAIVVGKLDSYDSQKSGIPAELIRIVIAAYQIPEDITWEELTSQNSPLTESAAWDPDEVLTIKYTSGTTGGPKGVMHSARAFDSAVRAAKLTLKLPPQPRLFSYLPLSHIAERVGIEAYGLFSGAEFSFAESLDTFAANLRAVEPDLFFAVPRIWAKFQEKILEKLPQHRLNFLLRIPGIRAVVKRSIRKKLGLARATHIYSGAAPISADLLAWFENIGITIFQALGMTEDGIYSHFNKHGANRAGTVGQALSGLHVKVSSEGELRLKSPSVMKGYYKDPDLTRQAFDEEGYLRTGDLVSRDQDGFVTVVGRIKDQFKTDKGKYISPGPIESKLLANPDIEQVCVVGMGIPQPIALIGLSAGAKAKAKDQVIRGLLQTLNTVNTFLQDYEQLAKAVIMKNDWTVENGLITPTLKVKRMEVEKIHMAAYPAWFKEDGLVVWE